MPDGKEQRLEKRQRRPSGFASRRRVDVHQQTVELSPVNQPRQLIKRRGPPTAFFAEPEHLLANPATRLGKPLKPLLRLRESPLSRTIRAQVSLRGTIARPTAEL